MKKAGFFIKMHLSRLVLIGCGGLYIAAVYNSCGQVQFQNTPSETKRRLSSVATIVINNDDEFTNKKSVKITLANPQADEMYVTNDRTCKTGGVWEPFASEKAWNLAQENQTAHVYAKFRTKDSTVQSSCVT